MYNNLSKKSVLQITWNFLHKIFMRRYAVQDSTKCPQRILSGIQPTGTMHIGNYLGAICNWVALQNSGKEVLWSIADMHSLTLHQNPQALRENIFKMTAMLIACGIDPTKSILFQQSSISMHAELFWILSCITTMPRLAHLPQFKEKSAEMKNIPLGLYVYPVLQSADILLYRATHVPVGQDQVQHIQLAQDLAHTFNMRFGNTFPIPHSIVNEHGKSRIKSLRDPMKKMSKSSNDPKGRIEIMDEPDILLKKIKKSVTDFTSEVTFEPETRPGVSNLVMIHSLITGKTTDDIVEEAKGLDTAKYKLVCAQAVMDKLHPIRTQALELMAEKQYLEEVLREGGERASEIGIGCLHDVREKVGFGTSTLFSNVKNTARTIEKI